MALLFYEVFHRFIPCALSAGETSNVKGETGKTVVNNLLFTFELPYFTKIIVEYRAKKNLLKNRLFRIIKHSTRDELLPAAMAAAL